MTQQASHQRDDRRPVAARTRTGACGRGPWVPLFLLLLGVATMAGALSVLPPRALAQSQAQPGGAAVPEFPEDDEDPFAGFVMELLIPDSRRTASPEELDAIRFEVRDLLIEGVTIYSDAEVLDIYERYLGQEISLNDLYSVAEQLETRYRADGYVITQVIVPAQRVGDGVFRIEVIEGFISEVLIQGADGPVLELIESYVNKVTASRPLQSDVLQRYLLLADDIPGVDVTAVLRPSSTETGASQVVVTVSTKEIDGFIQVQNRGSKYNGPWQGSGGIGVNAQTRKGERTSFIGLITRDWDEQRYAGISYEQAIGSEGMRIKVEGSHSTSEPGFDLNQEGNKIRSKASTLAASITYPYQRTREESLTFEGKFTVRNTRTELEDALFQKERLRVLMLGGEYSRIDNWNGANRLTVGMHQGLTVFGATEPREVDIFATRTSATTGAPGASDFTKFTAEIVRRQRLTENLSLVASINMQYSWDRLLATEEFRVGGARYGRAYDDSELTGDSGVAMITELRYGEAVEQGDFLGDYVRSFDFFAFYDIGQIWNNGDEQGLDETSSASIASAGIGMQLQFIEGISASIMYAKPLTRGIATENEVSNGVTSKQRRTGRYFFSLTSQF